jgi:putative nucleotidyltransferase with HDIG domain
VNDAIRFLTMLAQTLATMTLYKEGHPARERVIDTTYDALRRLIETQPKPLFTFLGDESVRGAEPIRELRAWDWTRRFSNAGVQRLEFEPQVTRDELEEFHDLVLARMTVAGVSSATARPTRESAIRFGTVGIRGEAELENEVTETVRIDLSLGIEAETVRWLHDQIQREATLHLAEAEAVVRSLSVAMHGDRHILLPLLRLRNFDEYTTTHSLNVAVLAMALAEFMGLPPNDVRAFGVAGLLHDIGKVNIPHDVLNKPGKLTPEERDIINRHPVDGARIIIEAEDNLDLAAVVAYEHHIMIDGRGYPELRFPRDCHYASRMVHVCDVYDALRTNRPYRAAWAAPEVLAYIASQAGTEFDPELAHAFGAMMEAWEPRIVSVDEHAALPG